MRANDKGDDGMVHSLIAAGARIDARNADGNNALWLACVGARLDVMATLIEAGIDIDNHNDNGATSLCTPPRRGKAAVVERLPAAGANITLETLDGCSALDMAATGRVSDITASGVPPTPLRPQAPFVDAKSASAAAFLQASDAGRKESGSATVQASLNRRSSVPARRAPGASGG